MAVIKKIKLNDNIYNVAADWNDIDNKPTIPTKTSDLTNDSGFLTQHQDISGKEDVSNKVNLVSNNSTDNQYPSAKCLYDRTHWVNVDNIDNAIDQDCFYIYTTGTSYNKQIYFLICVGDNVENSGGVRTQYRCNATPGTWERTIQYRSQRYSNSKNGWINDKDEVGAWTDWTSISSSSGGATVDAYTKAEIDTQRATIFNTIDETAIQSLIKQYDLLVLENNEQFNTYGTQELIDYIEADPKEDTDYTTSNVPDNLNGHYEVPLGFEITIPEGGKIITIFDTVIKQSWIDNIENNENKWANITINQDNQNKYYITNLIPNRLYTYTIKNSNGEIIDTGKCQAKDSIRFIDAGKVVPYNLTDPTVVNTATRQYYNIRDLGGWSCDGGNKLKYGVIYRGCELSGTYTFGTSPGTKYGFQLPDYQKSLFKDFLKIRDEIDLRQNSFILGTSYTETAGDDGDYDTVDDIDESAIGAGVSYGHFPGIGYKLNEDVIVTVDGEQITYNSRIHYINAIKRIAQDIQNNKPIYIHCSAGADRTGTLCMLIEALCGVSKADLDKDYELTSYSKNFKSQQNTRKRLSNDWKNLLSYIKNNYEPYSESFRDQVIAFLIQSGVTIDEINIIRGGLIDGTVDNIKHPYAKTDIVVNLTNASIDNDITKIEKYSPFKAKISVKDGYVLNQLSITMSSSGHTSDITNSVYSNGIINIPKVIGVVHITGTAVPDNTLYQTLITSNNKLSSDLVDDTNSNNRFVTPANKSTWNSKYTKPNTGIPKTDLADDIQSSLTKADNSASIETGTITNNYGWYDAGTQLTGSYTLFGDLCIITGYAEVKTGRGEIWYSLPVAAVQGAAAIAMDGGNYYCIGTSAKDNVSVMRITKMDGEDFPENKTIHFVLTYKCQ